MTTITASMVSELRAITGYSMMKCKDALVYAEGDMLNAELILHKTRGDVPVALPRAGMTQKQLEMLLDYIDIAICKAMQPSPELGIENYHSARSAWLKKQLFATIKE